MKLAIVAAEFTAGRGQPAAPRDGDLPQCRHDPQFPREDGRGHGRGAATSATSPSAASSRSRGSAATASPKAMRSPSPSWSMSRPGSNATTRRSSPAPCSMRSRWASTPPRRSSATRASMASRCAPPTSIAALWDSSSSATATARSRCGWASARSTASRQSWAEAIVAAREAGPFDTIEALARRAALPRQALRLLADADACRSIGLDRREALWEVRRMPGDELPLFAAAARARAGRGARRGTCRRCRSPSMSRPITRRRGCR